jgi:hypothetical protein
MKSRSRRGGLGKRQRCAFSLDETFDVGEDTGTPVLEDYADTMPFRFTGTLKRFAVLLEPLKLSADEQRRLHRQLAEAMAAVQ